jgi:hypothetical protein
MEPWIRPVLVDVRRREVGFRIDGSLHAVGTAREAGEAKAGRVALQFLACFVHQIGGAEQTDAHCRYVVGSKLDGAEHSGVVSSNVQATCPYPAILTPFASPRGLALSGAGSIGPTKSALHKARSKGSLGIPDDAVLGLLVPDALEEVGGVLHPRVTERVLNPIRNAAKLVNRQSGDVRGAVTEQRLTFAVGVVGAVAKASTASRLTGLSISEIRLSSTEQGLGATAARPKF